MKSIKSGMLRLSYLSALREGMAVTLPTGLGPTAGGIITSNPPAPLEGLAGAPRLGLTGRGLCGGVGEGFGWSAEAIWD